MNFPFYTEEPPKSPRKTPVELPPSRQKTQTRPDAYLPYAVLVKAVNVALLLGQPLLLTGEPGTGKTQLAPLETVQNYLPDSFEHTEPRRSVVLIDEIDKAPNDILNEVENMYFRIPELGNVKIEAAEVSGCG